jgi:predicted lipoprotein with Yx(FWY)xxD motif
MRKLLYAGVIAAGLLASGCGSAAQNESADPVAANEYNEPTSPETSPSEYVSGMTSPAASPTSPVMATPTGPARIDVAQTSLGKILVGTEGRTLYLFSKDKNGQSACTAACAAAWPPALTVGQPQAGTGTNGSLLGTVKRDDGTTQVTYNKHPLYYYAKDQRAGDVTGQDVKDFGGEWYAVTPEGKKAKH